MTDTKLQGKILKLLRLADAGEPGEAAAAMAAAQRLAAQADLDLDALRERTWEDADADAAWTAPEVVKGTTKAVHTGARIAPWRLTAAKGAAEANGCGSFYSPGKAIYVYGQPLDVERAAMMFEIASTEIERLAKRQRGDRRWMRAYRQGAASAVADGMRRANDRVLAEGDLDGMSAMARSVALDRVDQLARYRVDASAALDRQREGLGLRKSAARRVGFGHDAYRRGRADGRTVTVGNGKGSKALG